MPSWALPNRTIHFNPRPPRGGRRRDYGDKSRKDYFNPRPPRGGRLYFRKHLHPDISFQSTPSARRATGFSRKYQFGEMISIHALREEGDATSPSSVAVSAYFNPRPPRGGRRDNKNGESEHADFNPRPPRGGRRASGDLPRTAKGFQSTPSARRATATAPATPPL